MFNRVLIANRGEIACRIISTCRRLGIATVAVYSDADAGALHVQQADEAICIGPAAARDSYLRIDRVVAAAVSSGAQAVHPGYGFLSENADLASACADAGLIFIGPPAAAIRAMGSKSAAKTLMEHAGVPLVPGYHGNEQQASFLQRAADAIGYPVLIKPAAGGGGKGMRVVTTSADFAAALISCQREARAGFGDDQVLIEKYLPQARHVEVQIFGDSFGGMLSLYERDCSAQRRQQKVVEEAPAPGLSAATRAAMAGAACEAARAVGYVGAGTVEFIVDESGAFHFMEMNTRLQVEHPVTEMITGLDLVEWQLRVAAGEPLPLQQPPVSLHGHAIEARVYAEDPEKGFLPGSGRLVHFRPPPTSTRVRVDSGVRQGDAVTPYYDPLLAKLIVWGETRESARVELLRALGEFQVAGVGNNIAFLTRLVEHPAFRAARMDTGLIERELATLLAPVEAVPVAAVHAAVLWSVRGESLQQQATTRATLDPHSPWGRADGWRLNATQHRRFEFRHGAQSLMVTLQYAGSGWLIDAQPATIDKDDTGPFGFTVAGIRLQATVVAIDAARHVFLQGRHHVLAAIDPLAATADEHEAGGGLTAPMSGTVIELCVVPGQQVAQRARLLVLEAMKMEHTLRAPANGRVMALLCQAGEQVAEGTTLVDFQPDGRP